MTVGQMTWESAPDIQAQCILGADVLYDPGMAPMSNRLWLFASTTPVSLSILCAQMQSKRSLLSCSACLLDRRWRISQPLSETLPPMSFLRHALLVQI